jgi:hypothetical protein
VALVATVGRSRLPSGAPNVSPGTSHSVTLREWEETSVGRTVHHDQAETITRPTTGSVSVGGKTWWAYISPNVNHWPPYQEQPHWPWPHLALVRGMLAIGNGGDATFTALGRHVQMRRVKSRECISYASARWSVRVP